VVAYALAGTVDRDLYNEPLGVDRHGDPVYLREIWPTNAEIQAVVGSVVQPEMFEERYSDVFSGNPTWNAIEAGESELYTWDPNSTYIQEPPFFDTLTRRLPDIQEIRGARVLAVLGDSITTDHISPAGAISQSGPAGKYLMEAGVAPRDFNSYGSRRGNDRVMTRGTFANIRLRNRMVPGVEGGMTLLLPEGEMMSIFEAAMRYKNRGVPLVVLAGKEYGTGSSRDWAAKGALLLGVKAVLAESFERIHRSNLVGMGVLPLVYKPGENAESLGLTGRESFTIEGLSNDIQPKSEVTVTARNQEDGTVITFQAIARLDTPTEIHYFRNGGILHTVLRNLLEESQPAGATER
jgi:aconitate hydratase